MPSNRLDDLIISSASEFALRIINAVRSATIQELTDFEMKPVPNRPTRRLVRHGGQAPIQPPAPDMDQQPIQHSDQPPMAAPTLKPRKKRTNYPKCAYPGCEKNRFPRGKGFCGDHWRKWELGEIKSAEEYRRAAD